MADLKISQLPAASTPLDGTEVLPVVKSGATDKVSVANLTAGRAVSAASLTLTTTPLGTSSGGTGLSSFTANGVVYASSTSALTTDPTKFDFNGKDGSIGVTVSSWGSSWRAFQIGYSGSLASQISQSTVYVGSNWYYSGGDKYINDGTAALYLQYNGGHQFFTAASGTAGGAMTKTNILTTDTSGNFNFAAGNVSFGTAAKGINFTANTAAAGMTSQLLNWYEEGTWTGSLVSSGGGSVSLGTSCVYTRIGRVVNIIVSKYALSLSGLSAGNLTITGLPFTCSSLCDSMGVFFITGTSGGAVIPITAGAPSSTTINLYKAVSANENVSYLTKADLASTITIAFSLTYIV